MIRTFFAFIFAGCLIAAAGAMAPSNNMMLMLPHKHVGNVPVMVPVNTGGANLPTVTGPAQVGQTLTGTNGIWANNPTSYRYMWTWEDCGTDNTRTAITTVPIASDIGHQLCFSVWAKNAAGESTRVMAALTATVTAAQAFNPANPGASGYALVFDDEFNSINTIDVNNTGAPGFNWYASSFVSGPTPANYIQVSGGALTLLQSANSFSYGIGTAGPANNADGFVGRAFGGGAYYEARVKFNPANVNPATTNWPSFWADSLELWVNNSVHSAHWPGQSPTGTGPTSGYNHFVEDDFFEYDLGTTTAYNGALHDWYGQIGQCGDGWYCDINNNPQGGSGGPSGFTTGTPSVPGGTDWTQYHILGSLWVPGTAANGFHGFVQRYFDGVANTDKVTWVGPPNANPPPSGGTQFSVLDQQHMVVALGTGTTNNIGFTIDYVHVWQIPGQGTCIGSGCTSALAPTNVSPPTVTGASTAQVGQQLIGTNGTWTNSPTGYRYMWTWEDCGTDNTRTAISTVPVTSDIGHQLCFSVWAHNASGESTRVEAALTATVTQGTTAGIWTASNYANSGVRGFNQPGDMSLASFQEAAGFGAKVMRVFINQNTGGGTNNLSNNGSQYTIGGGVPGTFDFTSLDGIVANAQAAGLKVILVIDDGKALLTNQSLQNSFVAMWQAIATHYNGNATIGGYDLWNEPAINGSEAQWIPLSQTTTAAIRAIDSAHVIIWEPFPWGLPYSYDGMTTMPLASYTNIVYSYHDYDPHMFTSQTLGYPYGVVYPTTGGATISCYPGGAQLTWTASTVGPNSLNCDGTGRQTILNLQAQYGFPIFVGELSAFTAAPTNANGTPSATQWVDDTLTYIHSKGMSWAYHSWNEYFGWDATIDQSVAISLYNSNGTTPNPVPKNTNSLTSQALKRHFSEP